MISKFWRFKMLNTEGDFKRFKDFFYSNGIESYDQEKFIVEIDVYHRGEYSISSAIKFSSNIVQILLDTGNLTSDSIDTVEISEYDNSDSPTATHFTLLIEER